MRTIHSKTRIAVLFCLGFLLVCSETLLAQRVQILNATNTLWRYHPNSVDPAYAPADAWVDPTFDDSTWSGPSRGLFGTEVAGIYPYPVVTSIPSPSGSGGALVSSYFRVHFNWTGHAQGVELIFTNYVDDGLLVYLNGVELWAWNMPPERPVPWNISTLPGAANPIPEPSILMTNITANLIQGDNVLAVQLQQHGTGSSDDVFGMWMWGVIPFPPTNRVDTQPTNRVVLQSRSTTLSAVVDGSPIPTYQWYKDGLEIDSTLNPTATNANLVISQMTAGDAGNYYAIATNPAGSVQTRTATVGYTADTVAPRAVRAVGSPTFTTITIEYDEGMSEDEIDVPADMTRLTLDTIGLCGFGYRFNSFYSEEPHPFVAAMIRCLDLSMHKQTRLPVGDRLRVREHRQFQEDTTYMNSLVDKIIAERKASGDETETKDLLNSMLTGVDRESGEKLDDVNIRYQIITFLIAGHEAVCSPSPSTSCSTIPTPSPGPTKRSTGSSAATCLPRRPTPR